MEALACNHWELISVCARHCTQTTVARTACQYADPACVFTIAHASMMWSTDTDAHVRLATQVFYYVETIVVCVHFLVQLQLRHRMSDGNKLLCKWSL